MQTVYFLDLIILSSFAKSQTFVSQFSYIFRAQVISPCSSNSACLQVYCWKLLHLSLWTYHINFSFIICAQSSLRTSWACSNTVTILLVFARSRVFKLAGKTHYSNVSFRVGTGLSALVFTSSPVLAFTGKLPYSGSFLKTRVSQGK